jgi:hypothetical protein
MSTQKCGKQLTVLILRLCFAINTKACQFFDYYRLAWGESVGKPRVLRLPF